MAQSTNKIRARKPRGFDDRGPAEVRGTERMLESVREVYELYGFEPVETPAVEYTDVLGKFLPDEDRPNEGVFSFLDDDEQWLSLRYDLTAPLARYVAENFDRLPKPYRSYRLGWVFRNEKPGPGRFRQFMQFDADTVGASSIVADAEICMMAADCMERLGIPRGDYIVKVNNRKVLDGVLEAAGLGGDAHTARRLAVLRAIDKLDRLGLDGVRALLGPGRMDESGDFTRGAGLDPDAIRRIVGFVTAASEEDDGLFSRLTAVAGGSATGAEGVDELSRMAALFEASGYGLDRVRIDPSVVRGLEYYTGPVYETELTFETVGDDGAKIRFGSVAGGGRYDGLVARFRGEPVPAAGFSIGVSRLQAALSALGKLDGATAQGPVVVLVLDRAEIARYQRMVAALRGAGIRSELYLGDAGLKGQLKYADRRGSPCVVIQGSNERLRNEVQVKDLIEGARIAATIEDHETYRELRPAQITVPEPDLVAAVREILTRHE